MPAGDKKTSNFTAISTFVSGDKIVALDVSESELRTVTGTALLAWLSPLAVANGGTGRTTSTTAYGLIAAGTTATGAHQTLAAGATTEILVGGGAAALPVWTTATGSGAPVRATSPTLVTPLLGTPTSGTLTNCTGLPIVGGTTGTLTIARGGTGATSLAAGKVPYSSGGTAYAASGIWSDGNDVGIGTESPAFTFGIETSGGTDYLHKVITSNNTNGIRLQRNEGGGSFNNTWNIYQPASSTGMVIGDAAGDFMHITTAGDIIISASASAASPSALLHLIKTTEQLRVGYDTSNYLHITVSSTGSVTFAVTGTNPDIIFTPTGTGNVMFGTHSSLSGESVSGYITIKDSGGTSRKLAVVS